MEIEEAYLVENPCYKSGRKIKVSGLMLHSTGCPQPSAEVFVKSWNCEEAKRACVHAFIDAGTGKIYQTLPWEYRAWHCGGTANNTHIGVEMCEPACIKYTQGSAFTCSDTEKAKEAARRTYNSAAKLFAFLCNKYGLDPLADGVIISHREGHERGLASGHMDPEHLWNGLGLAYTMDGFRNAVKNAMENRTPEQKEQPDTGKEAGEMRISDAGVELIAGFEGCRLQAYRCAAGVWTIGYGHTEGVKEGDMLATEEEAKKLLKKDLEKYAGYVNESVKKGLIAFPLSQNQFDALTSFTYNCGKGNLQRLTEGRTAAAVAEKMLLYNKGGGKVLAGLTRRREEEHALFLKED